MAPPMPNISFLSDSPFYFFVNLSLSFFSVYCCRCQCQPKKKKQERERACRVYLFTRKNPTRYSSKLPPFSLYLSLPLLSLDRAGISNMRVVLTALLSFFLSLLFITIHLLVVFTTSLSLTLSFSRGSDSVG